MSVSPNRFRTCGSFVEDEGGNVVGEAVTDAEGVYLIPLADPGTYVVRIDVETLPEGLEPEEGKDEQAAEVGGNQKVTRAFFLGEDSRDVKSKWSLLPQTLANGLKLAMIIAITLDRPVADLRHDRPVQLRPRRNGDLRRVRSPSSSTPTSACTSSRRHSSASR